MKHLVVISMLLFVGLNLYSQSAKEVRELNIEKKTTSEIDYEKGASKPILEREEQFNSHGDIIELKEYTDGKVINWVKYEYDSDKNIIKEIYQKPNGTLLKTITYLFKDGLKIEKAYYDEKDRLLKKKLYAYKLRK